MSTNKERHRGRSFAGVAALMLVLVVGMGESAGRSRATGTTGADAEPDPASVIALLDTAPDPFPPAVDVEALSPGGLDRGTLHRLGSEGARSYWTGLDRTGDICLVVILDARLTTAASCGSATSVEQSGRDLSAHGGSRRPVGPPIVALLLPDSAAVDQHGAPIPWTRHGPNLVVARQADMIAGTVYEFPRSPDRGGPAVRYPR